MPSNQSTGSYTLVVKAWNSSGAQVYAAGGLAPFTIGVPVPPTPTPTPVVTGSSAAWYDTGVTVSPSSVSAGGAVNINFSLTPVSAQSAIVDVDIADSSGQWVANHQWPVQSFNSGQTISFSTVWPVPATQAAGSYSLVVKVFSPTGTQLFAHGGQAAFSVTALSTPIRIRPEYAGR